MPRPLVRGQQGVPRALQLVGRNIESDKTALDYATNADACKNPVCGVCDYNNNAAAKNLELGNVAAWTFMRVYDDNYLIFSDADGNGMRCLGFDKTEQDEIVEPYPQLISVTQRVEESMEGQCGADGVYADDADECTTDDDCSGDTPTCIKEMMPVFDWTTDAQGPEEVTDRAGNLNYFCGFEGDEHGTPLEKLKADPQALWNVHQLGCEIDQGYDYPRWYCKESKYDGKFVLRSYADYIKLTGGEIPNDSYKVQCLYFPDGNGQYTHPRRVPTEGTPDGVWIGGLYNGDANDDHDCGIFAEGMNQEEALIEDGSAVFHLIRLPSNV